METAGSLIYENIKVIGMNKGARGTRCEMNLNNSPSRRHPYQQPADYQNQQAHQQQPYQSPQFTGYGSTTQGYGQQQQVTGQFGATSFMPAEAASFIPTAQLGFQIGAQALNVGQDYVNKNVRINEEYTILIFFLD